MIIPTMLNEMGEGKMKTTGKRKREETNLIGISVFEIFKDVVTKDGIKKDGIKKAK